MKVAVVTSIFGGIDQPKPFPVQECFPPLETPEKICPAYDRVVVTEDSSSLPVSWRPVRLREFVNLDARMQARYFKIKTHEAFPGYKAVVWIDGSIQIKSTTFLSRILAALEGNHIAMARHPERGCIYDEAAFVANRIKQGNAYLSARYRADAILQEAEAYRAQGHPPDSGLYWCGLFARRVGPRVNRFFNQWWEHCLRWPKPNDQISFAYLVRKLNMKIAVMDWGNQYDNATYKICDHLKVQ